MILGHIDEWRRGLAYKAATNSYLVTCEQMEELTDMVGGVEDGLYILPRWLRPRPFTRSCRACIVISYDGDLLALLCPHCGGIVLNTDATFCPHCGARVKSVEDDGDETEEVSNG